MTIHWPFRHMASNRMYHPLAAIPHLLIPPHFFIVFRRFK
jgi:hypothetical protein